MSDRSDRARAFSLAAGDRPRVMGVLNATPDSFSGDGVPHDPVALVERGLEQVRDGAELLDLGAESTRPGSTPVPTEEELARLSPVLSALLERLPVPLSIDTQKASVAARALGAGATIVNDVSGLHDPEMARVVAAHHAWLVLTHNGWTMGRRAGADVVREVIDGLQKLVEQAQRAGVPQTRLIADPGLGFGKSPPESLELLRRISELRGAMAPLPLLVGPSRKGFVGRALGLSVDERLEGTLACAAIAAFAGAELIRVHDVQPAVRTVRMAWAVRQGRNATLVPESPA